LALHHYPYEFLKILAKFCGIPAEFLKIQQEFRTLPYHIAQGEAAALHLQACAFSLCAFAMKISS
jgi:hypothetical protein